MARYHLAEPVHLETHHETHGPIELAFPAGDVEPRSEQEEAAFQHLVGLGLAELAPEKTAKKTAEPEAVTDAPQ